MRHLDLIRVSVVNLDQVAGALSFALIKDINWPPVTSLLPLRPVVKLVESSPAEASWGKNVYIRTASEFPTNSVDNGLLADFPIHAVSTCVYQLNFMGTSYSTFNLLFLPAFTKGWQLDPCILYGSQRVRFCIFSIYTLFTSI